MYVYFYSFFISRMSCGAKLLELTRFYRSLRIQVGLFFFAEGKALAVARDCKFIETSSGIQHNVDELLVGILKQIRLRESREKKKSNLKKENNKLHGSKTSLSLNIAREILQKICMNDISKSKSCENLHVL